MAHPDDAEILVAGTLARLKREHGAEIHIATTAMGDLGSVEFKSADIARIRNEEGIRAASLLGGSFDCLGERDLTVRYHPDLFHKAVALLRKVRADIVITHSPTDYLLDHEQTSLIARAAAFGAPIPNLLPDLPPIPRIPWLYYADPIEGLDSMGNPILPDFLVDITDTMAIKEEMLACHASQRDWLRKHHGMDEYIESMKRHGRILGLRNSTTYAEGFRQHRGHSYPQTNIIEELLSAQA